MLNKKSFLILFLILNLNVETIFPLKEELKLFGFVSAICLYITLPKHFEGMKFEKISNELQSIDINKIDKEKLQDLLIGYYLQKGKASLVNYVKTNKNNELFLKKQLELFAIESENEANICYDQVRSIWLHGWGFVVFMILGSMLFTEN